MHFNSAAHSGTTAFSVYIVWMLLLFSVFIFINKMKRIFYFIVCIYALRRSVYAVKDDLTNVTVEQINYGEKLFWKSGSNHTVNCYINNINQEVQWKYPSGDLVLNSSSRSRIFARKTSSRFRGRGPSLALNFRNLYAYDSGVYECRSGNSSGQARVCVIKPLEFVDTPTEVTVDLHRSITLRCQAVGEPEPTIIWQRSGEDINDDLEEKYKVMTKYNRDGFEGLLTIISLDPEDSGVYSCIGIQEFSEEFECSHRDIKTITLHVNHYPIFKDFNETEVVYGITNQSVSLICSASAYPAPSYKWFRDDGDKGLFIFDDKDMIFNEIKNKAILTVVADSSTYGKVFKCQASNIYGDADKYFVLHKMEKPKTPSEIINYNSSESQIDFNLTWYDGINFPVEGFYIQYLKVKDAKNGMNPPKVAANWKSAKLIKINKLEDGSDDSIELKDAGILVTLTDLEEGTEYWVRLRATNNAGESPWSDPILAATTSKLEEEVAVEYSNAMYYGIFFFGGVLVVAFVYMFTIRLV